MTEPTRASAFPILALTALLVLGGCDAPLGPEAGDPPTVSSVVAAGRSAVSVPFKARLFTAGEGLAPDASCGAPPRLLNTQVGEGVATHLGRFSVRITFCMDVTDFLDDLQLTEGESLPYDNGIGTLVAANGDELYLEISGEVVPSAHPDFDLEFHDRFRFTGGTGRFSGASGEGTTDSFVDQEADRTQHEWRGTLVLPRGR